MRQDTNGLALHTLAPVLGVSKSMDLEVNSMAVPRKARQAVGGIAKLKHDDGRRMTVRAEIRNASREGGSVIMLDHGLESERTVVSRGACT